MKNKKKIMITALVLSLLMVVMTPISMASGIIAQPSTSTVCVNGKPVALQAYSIAGNNYFKLRDLGKEADFGVTYDASKNTILINTSEGYRENKTVTTPAGKARVLAKNNWSPSAYNALTKLIKENGSTSSSYDSANKPYAVFDCDNTTVINDVEEALLIYQLENLSFKIKPEQMADVLKTGIPDVTRKFGKDYANAAGKELTVAVVAEDCAKSYEYLYKNYTGFGTGGKMSLEEIQKTNEYKDFTTKVRFLYDAVNGTFDASVGYPWVTYLFTGMTSTEVQQLAEKSHDYWLNYGKFTKETWTSPAALPGQAGVLSVSYKTGLTFPTEMVDLYNTLMENGIDVYVCSASFYDVILAAVSNNKYGYHVKPENVYAMMLKKDANGRFINEYDDNYFQTQGKGKSHTINAFIRGKYDNRGPILVAGDSAGDYNMITEYSDMKLGLIINRYRKDSFKSISGQAAASIGNLTAKYVLQGRDENTGLFRQSEKSILLGEKEEKLAR